jgi:SAM-dependent methyltransferase
MRDQTHEELDEISPTSTRQLSARLEPFDSYWQAPADVEKGYRSFGAYYRTNFLPRLPRKRDCSVLVVSCGPGYLVDVLRKEGYAHVLGIDSDPAKVAHALAHSLPCRAEQAFPFIAKEQSTFDVIVAEQELNHLTVAETIAFLQLCRIALKPGGRLVVYAMNGANPLVGSENLAHNIDHFYNVTEHSLKQLLMLGGFSDIEVFPLKLYVFWRNPLNYLGLAVTSLLELLMRVVFLLYGKNVRVLTKKIAAVAIRPT